MLDSNRTGDLAQNQPIDHSFTVVRPIRYEKWEAIEENRKEMFFIFLYFVLWFLVWHMKLNLKKRF
jgi:hypothetical protein